MLFTIVVVSTSQPVPATGQPPARPIKLWSRNLSVDENVKMQVQSLIFSREGNSVGVYSTYFAKFDTIYRDFAKLSLLNSTDGTMRANESIGMVRIAADDRRQVAFLANERLLFAVDGRMVIMNSSNGKIETSSKNDAKLYLSTWSITNGSVLMLLAQNGKAKLSLNKEINENMHARSPLREIGSASIAINTDRLEEGLSYLVSVSANGAYLAVGELSNTPGGSPLTLYRISTDSGVKVDILHRTSSTAPSCVRLSPAGDLLAIGAKDGGIKLLGTKVVDGKLLEYASFRRTNWTIADIAFSPNGKSMALCSTGDKDVWLVDIEKKISTDKIALTDIPTSLAFSPNGKTLAIGTFQGRVELWGINN
ncbi:WD40 repeat domain-containing protein [Urbifossiella limnaea]|uniref:WD40 repeat domain-containing protein n=1 Tax=Urbifossiella limnaea TaxID=2528023 RepID=UPI00192E577D|nr:hypothetical protein [Urbifossiella limnaea]